MACLYAALFCMLPMQVESETIVVGEGFCTVLLPDRPFNNEDSFRAQASVDEAGRQVLVVEDVQFTEELFQASIDENGEPVYDVRRIESRKPLGRIIVDCPACVEVQFCSHLSLSIIGKQQGQSRLTIEYREGQTEAHQINVISAREAFETDTESPRIQVLIGEGKLLYYEHPSWDGPDGLAIMLGNPKICDYRSAAGQVARLKGRQPGVTNFIAYGGAQYNEYLIEVVPNPSPYVAPVLQPIVDVRTPLVPWWQWVLGASAAAGLVSLRTRRLRQTSHAPPSWPRLLCSACRPSAKFGLTAMLAATVGVAVALGDFSNSAHRQAQSVEILKQVTDTTYARDEAFFQRQLAAAEANRQRSTPAAETAPEEPPEPGPLATWLGRDFVEPIVAVRFRSFNAKLDRERLVSLQERLARVKLDLARFQEQVAATPGPDEDMQLELSLYEDQVRGMEKECRQLEQDAIGVTDEQMSALAGLSGLKTLTLSEFPPDGLRHIVGLRKLESLEMKQATDRDLAHLAGLAKLRELSIRDAKITNDGIRHLAELKRLEHLTLYGTQVDDEGLQVLAGLPRLQTLRLRGTFSDAGLKHLRGLVHMQKLALYSSKVTNAGMQQLRPLRQLNELDVRGTQVTIAGIVILREVCEHLWHHVYHGEDSPF